MPITAEMLKQDPLLLFPRYAVGLSALQSNADINLEQGFATIRDEQGISRLMVLQLNNSPYNIAYQEQTAAFIQNINQQLNQLQVKPHGQVRCCLHSLALTLPKRKFPPLAWVRPSGFCFSSGLASVRYDPC